MKKKKHLRAYFLMESVNTVYIIDLYDKFSQDKIISTFRINGRWWAIKEVSLLWGKPQLSKIQNDEFISFHLYDTLEEAQQYVKRIKSLEGLKL